MKLLYLECRAGISGDMTAAALLDLVGEDAWPALHEALSGLGLKGARVTLSRIRKQGFAAVRFDTVPEAPDPPQRAMAHIERMIRAAGLDDRVASDALRVFDNLARAEAEVHGTDPSRVHFHEVGAADSILDIVSVAWALDRLAVDRLWCSALPLGSGTVRCAHGVLPVPAPATLILARDIPVYGGDAEGETVTPTGAALVSTLAHGFGPLPPCRIERVGIGAGAADRPVLNVLRAILAHADDAAQVVDVVQIETTIDDMNPEAYGPLTERLFASGALDVHLAPVQMKKGRPGTVVSVLSPPDLRDALARIMLLHSSSFGVRFAPLSRLCLDREVVEVETPFGRVRVKRGMLDGRTIKSVPEFEDCRARAAEAGVAYMTVYQAAMAAASTRDRD